MLASLVLSSLDSLLSSYLNKCNFHFFVKKLPAWLPGSLISNYVEGQAKPIHPILADYMPASAAVCHWDRSTLFGGLSDQPPSRSQNPPSPGSHTQLCSSSTAWLPDSSSPCYSNLHGATRPPGAIYTMSSVLFWSPFLVAVADNDIKGAMNQAGVK